MEFFGERESQKVDRVKGEKRRRSESDSEGTPHSSFLSSTPGIPLVYSLRTFFGLSRFIRLLSESIERYVYREYTQSVYPQGWCGGSGRKTMGSTLHTLNSIHGRENQKETKDREACRVFPVTFRMFGFWIGKWKLGNLSLINTQVVPGQLMQECTYYYNTIINLSRQLSNTYKYILYSIIN